MSIPLVQNNEKDSINTSIIAIKKNLERINSILGLVDSGSDIDTSEFVKKSDIVDVVQTDNMNPVTSNAVATSNAMPVDTVTSGNMHSVTSNGVYTELLSTMRATDTYFTRFFTVNTTVSVEDFVNKVVEEMGSGHKYLTFGWSNSKQGYITDGNTSLLMNGNFIMGYFRPFNSSTNWVYSHFISCNINNNKVYYIWVRRDSSAITKGIVPLN